MGMSDFRPSTPHGWKLAGKELQDEYNRNKWETLTVYVREDDLDNRLHLIHYHDGFTTGLWVVLDTETNQGFNGGTAVDAIAALEGWEIDNDCEHIGENRFTQVRMYRRGEVMLKTEENRYGNPGWWIASSGGIETSGYTAKEVLTKLEELLSLNAKAVRETLESTVF